MRFKIKLKKAQKKWNEIRYSRHLYIKKMKKSWLKSDSVCLAMSEAVALNLMFEDKRDHKLFFKCWKRYLGKMASIINYHLTPTGWKILFKTKDDEQIKSAYHHLRKQSRKAKHNHTLSDTSRMLSEHFRIFLSQFVRRSNAEKRRKGTKVMATFDRYVLNESTDYEYFFNKITRQIRTKSQTNIKYQADETQYDCKKELTKESIWKVGTRMYMGLEKRFLKEFGVVLLRPKSSVLRKYLQTNITPKPPPPHP